MTSKLTRVTKVLPRRMQLAGAAGRHGGHLATMVSRQLALIKGGRKTVPAIHQDAMPFAGTADDAAYEAQYHVHRARRSLADARAIRGQVDEGLGQIVGLSETLARAWRERDWAGAAGLIQALPGRLGTLSVLSRAERSAWDGDTAERLAAAEASLLAVIGLLDPQGLRPLAEVRGRKRG